MVQGQILVNTGVLTAPRGAINLFLMGKPNPSIVYRYTALMYALLVLFGGQQVFAQLRGLSFNHLTANEGLTQSINAYILHDSYGFVWISSIDGLNRFDGIHVKPYREIPGDTTSMAGKNVYSSLFEDTVGNIWFTTLRGLQCYQRKTDDFKRITLKAEQDSLLTGEMKIIHYDTKDQLYIRVSDQLVRYDIKSGEKNIMGNLEGIEASMKVSRDSTHHIIVSHWKGLQPGMHVYRYDLDERLVEYQSYFTEESDWGEQDIFDVWLESETSFWIAAQQGLVHLETDSKKIVVYNEFKGKKLSDFHSIANYSKTNIFISSSKGIWVFDLEQKAFVQQFVHEPNNLLSLADDKVSELYLDKQNNLWASIWGKGVDFANLDKVKFTSLKLIQESSQEKTPFEPGSIVEDCHNRIWLGSNRNGLMVLDAESNPIRELSITELGVKQVFKDRACNIWIVTWNKEILLFELNTHQAIKINLDHFQNNSIGELYQLDDGRMVLAGYQAKGLYEINRLDSKRFIVSPIEGSAIEKVEYDRLFQMESGKILISHSSEAISILDYSDGIFMPDTSIQIGGEVKSFYEDEGGICWIATTLGLMYLNLNTLKWKMLGEREGLSSPYVYGMLFDKTDRIWLSTNQGISTYNKQDSSFRAYKLADGLQGFEYNTNSYLRSEKDLFWLGGVNAYNIFRPEQVHDLTYQPDINIVAISVNDRPYPVNNVNLTNSLELPYSQNTIEFKAVSSEYSDPQSNLIKFQLRYENGDSYDRDWIVKPNNQASIRYAKVQPGKYKLHINASNSDGEWCKEDRTIVISIQPPFWMKTWFILLCSIALILAIGLGVQAYFKKRLRRKNLKIREQQVEIEHQKALEQERKRIARDMHDDLGSGLTQIKRIITKAKRRVEVPEVEPYLAEMEEYAEDLVENMQGIIWAMDSGQSLLEELVAYIRRYAKEYLIDNEIDCHIKVIENWPTLHVSAEIKRNVFLAVKEAIHNIVKHANASKVELVLGWEDGLTIMIQDNGIGIGKGKQRIYGNGIKNMKSRMADIKGEFRIEQISGKGVKLMFFAPL